MRMIERVSEYDGKDLNLCMFKYSIVFAVVMLCNLLWITGLYLISFCFYYFVTMTCCSNSANSYEQFLWYESFHFNVQLRRSYTVIFNHISVNTNFIVNLATVLWSLELCKIMRLLALLSRIHRFFEKSTKLRYLHIVFVMSSFKSNIYI